MPAAIIDQRIGRAAVLEEAVNDARAAASTPRVEENEVQLLGRPEVEVSEFEDGEPLSSPPRSTSVPEFELPEYDGLEVTVDAAEVTDEDVDKQLDALREPLRHAARRSSGRRRPATCSRSTSPRRATASRSRTLVASACPTRSAPTA